MNVALQVTLIILAHEAEMEHITRYQSLAIGICDQK